jgi:hypothetical protein
MKIAYERLKVDRWRGAGMLESESFPHVLKKHTWNGSWRRSLAAPVPLTLIPDLITLWLVAFININCSLLLIQTHLCSFIILGLLS